VPENKSMPTGPALPLQLKTDLILGMESFALGTDLPGGPYRFVRCLQFMRKFGLGKYQQIQKKKLRSEFEESGRSRGAFMFESVEMPLRHSEPS